MILENLFTDENENKTIYVKDESGKIIACYDGVNAITKALNDCEIIKLATDSYTITATVNTANLVIDGDCVKVNKEMAVYEYCNGNDIFVKPNNESLLIPVNMYNSNIEQYNENEFSFWLMLA